MRPPSSEGGNHPEGAEIAAIAGGFNEAALKRGRKPLADLPAHSRGGPLQ